MSSPDSASFSIFVLSSPEIAPISCNREVISPTVRPDFMASYNRPVHKATSSNCCPVPAATSPIMRKLSPVESASPVNTCNCLLAAKISSRVNGVMPAKSVNSLTRSFAFSALPRRTSNCEVIF